MTRRARTLLHGEVKAVRERPDLEVALLVARRRLRHLRAPVRLDDARHVVDAVVQYASVLADRHADLHPAVVAQVAAPDARRRRRLSRTRHDAQVGRRRLVDDTAVAVQQESGRRQREDVRREQLVLVADARHRHVPVVEHLPAGVRVVVRDLTVETRVVRRQRQFGHNVR